MAKTPPNVGDEGFCWCLELYHRDLGIYLVPVGWAWEADGNPDINSD